MPETEASSRSIPPASELAPTAEQALRRIVETVQDIIYVVAGDQPYAGRVELVSDHVVSATGWSAEDFRRDPGLWFGLIHPEDVPTLMESTGRMMSVGVPVVRTYRLRHRTGAWRWFEDRVAPIVDLSGKRLGFCGAARDVTDARDAQARAILTDRLAALGTLSACVAHELSNPLNIVQLALEALDQCFGLERSGGSSDPRHAGAPASPTPSAHPLSLIAEANDAVARMRTIVAELRGFSRDEDRRREVDPRESVERAIRLVSHGLGPIRLVRRFGDVPAVLANDVRLTQVFVNLLLNAAQASVTSGLPDREIRVVALREAGRAVIEIQDDGMGIAPDALARIFEPFYTSKPVGLGTGLGLFVSSKIVSDLGGAIEVRSIQNVGSTFRVLLPAARPND